MFLCRITTFKAVKISKTVTAGSNAGGGWCPACAERGRWERGEYWKTGIHSFIGTTEKMHKYLLYVLS